MKLCIGWLIVAVAFFTDAQIDAQIGTEANVAEGYIVVDDKAIQYYINQINGTESFANKRTKALVNITEDIDYMLTEANQLLLTLNTYGLNVQIRVRGINFLTTGVFPGSYLQNGSGIPGETAIQLFSHWLTAQNAHSNLGYDFALLFTGYDIKGAPGMRGLAQAGKICDPTNAVTVVEFNATYIVALVTAHEVAHLLGAGHDGMASDKVMATITGPHHKHRWSFAECSAVDIKEFLPLLTPNCLLTTNPASTTPESSWVTYSGRLLDVNSICERTYNDTRSYMCHHNHMYNNSSPKGDLICEKIYCHVPDTSTCTATYTSEGVICDNRRRCDNGKCVPDTSAASANVDTGCVLGDQKVLEIPDLNFIGSCQQLINQNGQTYCHAVGSVCCATCNRFKTNVKGCEYGDKNVQCPGASRDDACSTENAAICCYTCRDTVAKRSTDVDTIKEVDMIFDIKNDTEKDVKIATIDVNLDKFKLKITNNTTRKTRVVSSHRRHMGQ